MTRISDAELEVLEVIWEIGDWADIAQVHHLLSAKNQWAYNTVGTFMIRLEKKGYLEHKKRGKANIYRAVISQADYRRAETEQFIKQVHSGSRKSLLAALCGDQTDEAELDQLLRLLNDMGEKEED